MGHQINCVSEQIRIRIKRKKGKKNSIPGSKSGQRIKKQDRILESGFGLILKANPIEQKTESDTKSVYAQVTHLKSLNIQQEAEGRAS